LSAGHGLGVACVNGLVGVDADDIISGGTVEDLLKYCEENKICAVRSKKGVHIYCSNDEIEGAAGIEYSVGPFTMRGELRAKGSGYLVAPGTRWAATATEIDKYDLISDTGFYTPNKVMREYIENCWELPHLDIVINEPKKQDKKKTPLPVTKEVVPSDKLIRKLIRPYTDIRIYEEIPKDGFNFREGVDLVGRHEALTKICREMTRVCVKSNIPYDLIRSSVFESLKWVRDNTMQNPGDKDDKEIWNIVDYYVGKKEEWDTWAEGIDWGDQEDIEEMIGVETNEFKLDYLKSKMIADKPINQSDRTIATHINTILHNNFYSSTEDCWYWYRPEYGYYTRVSPSHVEAEVKKKLIELGKIKTDKDIIKSREWRDVVDDYKSNVTKPYSLRGDEILWGRGGDMRIKTDFLLNTRSGVVDLLNCKLLPHSPLYEFEGVSPVRVTQEQLDELRAVLNTDGVHDYLTKFKFYNVIHDIVEGDKDKVTWMLKMSGAVLTSFVDYNVMYVVQGATGAGKSVVVGTLFTLLGNTLGMVRELSEIGEAFGTSGLPGKRLLWSDEAITRTVDMGKVKTIVTGGRLEEKAKYMKDRSFSPECKIVVTCNDLPRLAEGDKSIERRITLLRLYKTFAGTKQDDINLETKLASGENLTGALLSSIAGLWMYQKDNWIIEMTEDGKRAVSDWLSDSDPYKQFVEEYLIHTNDDTDVITGKHMSDIFNQYVVNERNGRHSGKNTIIQRLKNHGVNRKKTMKTEAYYGYKFNQEALREAGINDMSQF
jgi:phage/plasmid-associated DNA primase